MWVLILCKDSVALWLQSVKCFVWLLNHNLFLLSFFFKWKNKVYIISNVRELFKRRTRLSSFFSLELIESCMNLERMSVVRDYAKFMNSIVFGTKFVPLEMKTFVNIGNSFGKVITLYSCYRNDSNSQFLYFFQNYLCNTKIPLAHLQNCCI